MKDIGIKLKAKRTELKLSYKDVSKMTKMPEDHIRAIEDGDIEHFQNDITYLRFYLRAYCKVLGISFDDVRDEFDHSIDEFTQTLSLKAIKEREEIEDSIATRSEVRKADTYKEPPLSTIKDRSSIRQNAQQTKRFRKPGKLDFSLISLLLIVVIVIGIIVFVMFNNKLNPSTSNNDTPTSETTTPTPEKETAKEKAQEKKTEEPKTPAFTTTEVAVNNYEISGLKMNELFNLDMSFTLNCWVEIKQNNTTLISKVYGAQEPLKFEGQVSESATYVINFGNYRADAVDITINGEKLTLNPEFGANGVQVTLTLTIKGN